MGVNLSMKIFRWLFVSITLLLLIACSDGDSNIDVTVENPAKQQSFNWKMVTTWPANFPVFQEGAERFADQVKLMSDGRLNIQVFAGGELVPALQSFDAVSQGTIEMGHGASYYWAGKVPAAQFFSAVPFGMTAKGVETWIYSGGGLEIWRELYKPFNVLPIPMGNTGVQAGGWFKKRIDSVDDLQGLRMRIPGLGGNVLKGAGGNPVLMSGSEIYTALERGILDATEWVGPYHDQRLGLNRAASYYYYPGWHEPGTELELLVNIDAWDQLPTDLKSIVENAAQATSLWMFTTMEYENTKALAELRTKQNIEILEFPAEVLAELRRVATDVLEQEASGSPEFKRVYENYLQFREEYAKWTEISDDSYEKSLRE
jgi:TRAP-type mannitol/chloroaromatic compound transport system substrate-binding protein